MSLTQRISAHLARRVERKPAVVTFISGVGVLLTVLAIGAGLLVTLVFWYGFGTGKFAASVSPDTIPLLIYSAIALAATGAISFAGMILGSCLLVASISQARYRQAYLWFAAASAILVLSFLLYEVLH